MNLHRKGTRPTRDAKHATSRDCGQIAFKMRRRSEVQCRLSLQYKDNRTGLPVLPMGFEPAPATPWPAETAISAAISARTTSQGTPANSL
jgi:hypothetical protein